MKWKLTSIIILAAFCGGIVVGARSPYTEILRTKQNTSHLPVSFSPSTSGESIAAKDFDQVKEGMTLAQVKQILGEPEGSSTIDAGNFKIVSYVWSTSNQSLAVGFENNRVISKVQTTF